MKILNTIDSAFGIAIGTAACYGAGYLYGAICNVNKTLAARAFAVTIAVKLTFDVIARMATGGEDKDAKTFYTAHLVGDALLATLHIVAFRHFNLMGRLGTAFFSFCAFIILLENIEGLRSAQKNDE